MTLSVSKSEYRDCFLFETSIGHHVYLPDESKIYEIDQCLIDRIGNRERLRESIVKIFGHANNPCYSRQELLSPPFLRSISLNVAQTCNMACSYCYAGEGRFGGRPRLMSLATAKAAIDKLLAESRPDSDVVIAFLGGEPLINRSVVHAATAYGFDAARRRGRRARFAITTNLTLLTQQDVELFRRFPFSVSVSVDGDRENNDRNRRMRDGSGSYERLIRSLDLFQRYGRPQHLSARMTVTAMNRGLSLALDHVIRMGLDEVRFSPVLVSPDPFVALSSEDLRRLLEEVILCGEKTLAELRAGRKYPFGNFEAAMYLIHCGSRRLHACSAGTTYLSANADGKLFACHRLVDDPNFEMGDITTGSNMERRAQHLDRNYVDRLEPCKRCWARYLCGGGCYHEVSGRGRVACSYVRGWSAFCLRAYVELLESTPAYFERKSCGGTELVAPTPESHAATE